MMTRKEEAGRKLKIDGDANSQGPILPPKMTTTFDHNRRIQTIIKTNNGPMGPHTSAIPKSKKTKRLLLPASLLHIITIQSVPPLLLN
uniref:Uncharacterized protein n=1 Tax=Populus trichocarpa TaxID=3694 RepID=A0A2K1XS17_POPTR